MKYIEEIPPGNCFIFSECYFVATSDFKNNNKRLCINLQTGQPRWLEFDKSVKDISIYTIDDNGNFEPIIAEPTNASTKNNNIP